MCGLIGWISKTQGAPKDRARQYVIDQFEDQKDRGGKGFGVVEISDDGFINVLRATEPVKMMLDLYSSKTRHLFLHHRSPTSSANTLDQTHPLEVAHEELKHQWLVMHNGTISNASKLKEEHEKLGYVYLTEYQEKYSNYSTMKFNDSEAFAIELARYLEGVTKEMTCVGGLAFMAIAANEKGLVHKVYLGTNGYGGINLEDYKYAFGFASEEAAGKEIKKDEVIYFTAQYNKEGKKDSELLGFTQGESPLMLKFAPIVSPYAGKHHIHGNEYDDEALGYNDHGKWGRRAGFGAHQDTRTTTKEPNSKKEFSSFGDIVDYVIKGKLGDAFNDTQTVDNEAVASFNLVNFNRAIVAGQIKEAEDIYSNYATDLLTWVDADSIIENALLPMEGFADKESPEVDDIIKGFQDIAKRRMSDVAKELVPVFRVASYAECVITLAYQFRADLTDPKKISAKIDAADPDKALDEQIERDVAEVFPGKDDKRTVNLLPAGPVTRDAEYKEVERLDTPAEAMEHEGLTGLQALKESADQMHPEEIYTEAENVGNTIKSAAELHIMEHLAKIAAAAVEEGLPIKIPFHMVRIKDELSRVERRFTDLGNLVKAAHEKEEQEEDIRYMSG